MLPRGSTKGDQDMGCGIVPPGETEFRDSGGHACICYCQKSACFGVDVALRQRGDGSSCGREIESIDPALTKHRGDMVGLQSSQHEVGIGERRWPT